MSGRVSEVSVCVRVCLDGWGEQRERGEGGELEPEWCGASGSRAAVGGCKGRRGEGRDAKA